MLKFRYKRVNHELLWKLVDLLLLVNDNLFLYLLFLVYLSFLFSFLLFLFYSFFLFFKLPFEVLKPINEAEWFDRTKHNVRYVGNQVKRDEGDHWESHDISSWLVLYEISKANQMIGHQDYENLIVLLPKVSVISVRLEPANVDYNKKTQEIRAEELKESELLKKDKRGCQD